jgi:hypothetical protein
MTEQYLADRAKRATRRKFDTALSKVPDAPPILGDELPPGYSRRPKKRAG